MHVYLTYFSLKTKVLYFIQIFSSGLDLKEMSYFLGKLKEKYCCLLLHNTEHMFLFSIFADCIEKCFVEETEDEEIALHTYP